jgi:hypothetical protein
MAKNITKEDIETWLSVNNLIPEKSELFLDFLISLTNLIKKTYLGGTSVPVETRITTSLNDNINHFKWCWNNTIQNFKKENIYFREEGEHYEYFKTLFLEIYYSHDEAKLKNEIIRYFSGIFDHYKPHTKYELDLCLRFYKLLDKNIIR